MVAGGPDQLGVLRLFRIQRGLQQQAGEADDRVERGADLVAHVGQERRLRPAGLFRRGPRLFEQVALLGQFGVDGEQAAVGRGELGAQRGDLADDLAPLGHGATPRAMSRRICLPSNSIMSAAA